MPRSTTLTSYEYDFLKGEKLGGAADAAIYGFLRQMGLVNFKGDPTLAGHVVMQKYERNTE